MLSLNKLLLVLSFSLLTLSGAQASQELMYSSSSIPDADLPLSVPLIKGGDLNKNLPKNRQTLPVINLIRVKVFPHTLKNDHLHGTKDIKTEVKLLGEDIALFGKKFNQLDLSLVEGKIKIGTSGTSYVTSEFQINSHKPIKILRKGNESKSHSYVGNFKFVVYDDGIMIINTLDIEDYLRGVVPKESMASWPLETLKAQTLAARSYAYYHKVTSKRTYFDVDDTARFQVYAGISAATAKTDQAIEETKGEVMTHKGKVITAFFHAYSGGRTDSAKNIFGREVGFCQGKEEIFSRDELKAEMPQRSHWAVEWTTEDMKKEDLIKKLKDSSHTKKQLESFEVNKNYTLSSVEENELFGSVKTLGLEQSGAIAELNFVKLRSALGWSNFPAYHFKIEKNDAELVSFKGNGWGHHVGLSQWGAMMMAKKYNKTYREIVEHYYTDIEIENLADF